MLCVREFAQRLVALTTVSPGERSDLLRLSARFSLRDLPDFFDIAWRGDLSDIVRPPIAGLMVGPRLQDSTPEYATRRVASRVQ